MAAISQMVPSWGLLAVEHGLLPSEGNVQIFPIWLLSLALETHMLVVSPEMGPSGCFTFKSLSAAPGRKGVGYSSSGVPFIS